MYSEYQADGRVKYVADYKDPYTDKRKRTTVIMPSDSPQNKNKAAKILNERIREKTLSANTSDITFHELYRLYYDEWKLSVKYRTIYQYQSVDKTILSIVDDLPVGNIDSRYLQAKVNAIFSKGYSTSSMKVYVGRIKGILKYGFKKGYLPHIVYHGVEIPKRVLSLEDEKTKRLDYISKDEFDIVRSHFAKRTDKKIMRILIVLYMTGMRFGELEALTYDDLDFENKTIKICGTYDNRSNTKTTTKTRQSTRLLSAPDIVMECLMDQMADNARKYDKSIHTKNQQGYIFFNSKGKPYTVSAFNATLKNNKNYFGLKSHITSHTFRHSHISLLAEMGMPLKAIMDRVGHSDSKTTIQIYTHVTQKMTDTMLAKLNEIQF